MKNPIKRIPLKKMPTDLAGRLAPRVERLGYLGEFFQCMAHEPKALLSFMTFTDDLKEALPDRLTETVALTVAQKTGNRYERHQHERLSVKLGFSRDWIGAVLALKPSPGALSKEEAAVQALTLACLERQGRGCAGELDAVVGAVGEQQASAVLFLIGRYLTHALIVNSLELTPPVPSIFEDGFEEGGGK